MLADFMEAHAITMHHEGVYSNDPDDPGGETLYGISRVHWPDWEGWFLVEDIKEEGRLEDIGGNNELKVIAESFYKQQFWDRWKGDDMPSQMIANEMFDTAVNLSVNRAGEFLQDALNLANRNQGNKWWQDLEVDGKVGPKTLTILSTALGHGQEIILHNVMNHLQAGYYIKRMRENPTMEKYIGWFNRTKTL